MSDLLKQLTDSIQEAARTEVQKTLESKGLSKEAALAHITASKDERSYQYVERIVRNNGFVDARDEMKFPNEKEREKARISMPDLMDAIRGPEHLNDAIGLAELRNYIPRVMTTIVREAVEPVIVLQNLFRRVNLPGAMVQVKFPNVGAMVAQDIGEGQQYPEQKLQLAGYVNAMMGKVGLKIALTDEARRYTSFDVVALHVRAAGRAMARHKERKCYDALSDNATVAYDNSGGASTNGSTGGRAFDFTGNDTLVVDDIFQMYADLVNAGFIPTDFIVNPIGWLLFARDPSLRAFAFWNGQPLLQNVEGNVGNIGVDPLGPSGGSGTAYTSINQATTQASLARGMWAHRLGTIVSPFVTFDTAAKTTSVFLVDREEVGLLIQDEDIVTDAWDDPSRDVFFQKWRERYGVGVSNDGEGLLVAKSVSILKGYDWENKSIFQRTGELPAL